MSGQPTEQQSSSGISNRTTGVLIVIGLLIVVGGVTAGIVPTVIGLLIVGILTGRLRRASSEAFEPPVNSTALRQGHLDTLTKARSFTYEEELSVESTDADRLIRDETITAIFNFDSNQSLRETSTTDSTRTAYGTDTENYVRIDDSSGDPQYVIPDRDIGPEPHLESDILAELETIDVEHQKTDAGHVYSASGVDAVSEGFLEAVTRIRLSNVDSFQSFEFEAVVSEQGVLKEFSYQIEIEDSGEVITVTRSGELKEIGTTEVREPTWLDDARQATS